MSDARVSRRSIIELARSAKFHQELLNPSGEARDMEEIYREAARMPNLPLMFGLQPIPKDASEMGPDDGRAYPGSGDVPPRVLVKHAVIAGSRAWHGRSRMTLAHGFAHIALHRGDRAYPRAISPEATPPYIRSDESAEKQAKRWAAFFLMPERNVRQCRSVEEIIERFRVSEEAACYRWDEVVASVQPRDLPLQVKSLLEDLRPTSQRRNIESTSMLVAWNSAPEVPGLNPRDFRLSVDSKIVEWSFHNENHERGWLALNGVVYSWGAV